MKLFHVLVAGYRHGEAAVLGMWDSIPTKEQLIKEMPFAKPEPSDEELQSIRKGLYTKIGEVTYILDPISLRK